MGFVHGIRALDSCMGFLHWEPLVGFVDGSDGVRRVREWVRARMGDIVMADDQLLAAAAICALDAAWLDDGADRHS